MSVNSNFLNNSDNILRNFTPVKSDEPVDAPASEEVDLPTEALPPVPENVPPAPSPELESLLKLTADRAIPEPEINHNIAAHFLGGSKFIVGKSMGSQPLEGADRKEIAAYFLKLLNKVDPSQNTDLKKRLEQIIEVETIVSAISQLHPGRKNWKKRAQLFSEWMSYRIRSLQVGEHLTMPSGWPRHAMLYSIARESENSFVMRVYNTGDGTEYHPQHQDVFNTQYMQVVKTSSIPLEKMQSKAIWQAHYEILHEKHPKNRDENQYSAQQVYIWLSALDENLMQNAMKEANDRDLLMRRGQREGICTFESLLLLTKDLLEDGAYQQVRDSIEELALRDYDAFLITKNLLKKDTTPCPISFSNEREILVNLGALELLEMCAHNFGRKVLRSIRKRRGQEKDSVIESRTEYLEDLQARIKHRQEQCQWHMQLHSEYPPLEKTTEDSTLSLRRPTGTIDFSSVPTEKHAIKQFIPIWPATHEDFETFFSKLHCALTNEESAMPLENQYDLLCWFFKTLPSADADDWQLLAQNADQAQSCLFYLNAFSTTYLKLLKHGAFPRQADLHFFHMQKVLCILLKLSESDTILKNCHIDVHALGLTEKSFKTGCLFVTDPESDKQIQASRHFLQTYSESRNDKHLLFRHLATVPTEKQAELTVGENDWADDPLLSHIWNQMPLSVKEEIRNDLEMRHRHRPPNALILATALCNGKVQPSIGYAALQQHILNMQTLWHCGFVTYCFDAPTMSIARDVYESWEKTGDPQTDFPLHFRPGKGSQSIDDAIATNCAPSSSDDERESLMKRAGTEKEIIESSSKESLPSKSMQCSEDRGHQLLKTLLFYTQNRHLLSKHLEQVRLSSFLLEPGLLLEQLKINPDLLFHLAEFINRGFQAFNESDDSSTALFFLRLGSQLQTYARAANLQPDLIEAAKLPDFLQQLHKYWEEAGTLKQPQKNQRYYAIAREALAFCGRGAAITNDQLPHLLKYRFFLAEFSVQSTAEGAQLDTEMQLGMKALIQYVSAMQSDPDLAFILSQALQLDPVQPGAWGFHLPVITSPDERCLVDLFTGEVFVDGYLKTKKLPEVFFHNPQLQKIFPHPETFAQVLVKKEASTNLYDRKFTVCLIDEDGGRYKVKLDNYQASVWRQFPDGSYHLYYDINKMQIPEGIKACACTTSIPWYNEKNHTISFIDRTGKVTHTYKDGLLVEEASGYCAVNMQSRCALYRRLQAFDSKAQVWKNAEGTPVRIDLPTYGLVLDINSKGIIQGRGSHAGFQLSYYQHVHSLTGLSNYLVLEHESTGERRVLLPMHWLKEKKDLQEPCSVSPRSWGPFDTSDYCTFSIQKGRKQSLYSNCLKDRLYLAYNYLAQGKYSEASLILQKQAEKLTSYDYEEQALLLHMINSMDLRSNTYGLTELIRLRAAALLLENRKLGKYETEDSELQRKLRDLNYEFSSYFERESHYSSSISHNFNNYIDRVFAIPSPLRLTQGELAALGAASTTIKASLNFLEGVSKWKQRHGTLLYAHSPLKPTYGVSFDSYFWRRPSLAAVVNPNILQTEVLPLAISEKKLSNIYLSLYAIAKSSKTDPQSCESRLNLQIWLTCMQVKKHKTSTDALNFLYRVLQVPREQVDQLPSPEELINHVNDSQLQEALTETLEKISIPTAPIAFPEASYSSVKHEKIKHQSIAPAVEKYKPLVTASISSNNLREDLPLVPHLSELFIRQEKQQTSAIAIKPITTTQHDSSFYAQSYQEMQDSIQKAVVEENALPHWKISRDNLVELRGILKQDINAQIQEIRTAKDKLLALANALPSGTLSICTKRLEVQLKEHNRVTPRDLELLYVKNDLHAYGTALPYLADAEIHILYAGTAQWLLLATEQQQRRRALTIIEQILACTDEHQKKSLVQNLYQTLSAKRAYDYVEHPEMLVLEHRRNLRLRPSQVDNLKQLSHGKDKILEIIMGSGKSDILLPLLAIKQADGIQLPIIIMPEELIDTEAPKLQKYALDFFGQKEIRVNWSDTTLEGLQTLLESLKNIRTARGFVAATAKELHDFYLEGQALQRKYVEAPNEKDKERLQQFDCIVSTLKYGGTAYIDEVDAQLRCSYEVLKALDEPQTVNSTYRTLSTYLYKILTTHPKITSNVYFEWSSAQDPKALPYLKERDSAALIEILSDELLSSDILSDCGVRFAGKDRQRILNFLRAPEGSIVELPEELEESAKNALAFVRKQLQVILPNCVGSIYEQSYGLVPSKKGTKTPLLPVPWKGARSPQVRSQFASYDEQMAYVFQSYYKMGVPVHFLEETFLKLKEAARLEMESAPILQTIETTEAYKNYAALIGKQLLPVYPDLNKLKTEDIEKIADAITKDPLKLNHFISEHILPHIVYYPSHISSNGHTLATMFSTVYGISGTIAKDKNTFHDRFEIHTDPTIVGKTLVCLAKAPDPIPLKTSGSQEEQLIALLSHAGTFPHAIMDVGALFKDIPPLKLAQILLACGKKQTPALTSVIYFDGNKRLILKDGCEKPEFYTPSLTDDPKSRITFYDQKHCTGTDILQDPQAMALMTVNKETTPQKILQGAWRMRGLANGQRVRLVYPEEIATAIRTLTGTSCQTLKFEQLISYAKHVEINKQLDDNRKSLFQQIHVEFTSACQQILEEFLDLSQFTDYNAAKELNDLMITKMQDSPFAQYGRSEELVDARDVFMAHIAHLSEQLNAWREKHIPVLLEKVKTYQKESGDDSFDYVIKYYETQNITKKTIDEFTNKMHALVVQATDPKKSILAAKLPKQSSVLEGTAIEVQQQQKKEHSVEMQQTSVSTPVARDCSLSYLPWKETLEKDYFVPVTPEMPEPTESYRKSLLTQLEAHPEIPAVNRVKQPNPIVTLSTALALAGKRSETNELFSSDLLVSLNAACSSKASSPFYGSQKLLEWTLIIQDKENPRRIQLLILSRKEAEFFQRVLQKERTAENLQERPYNIALFSPRLHGMNFGNGIYEEGSEKIDKNILFSKPEATTLTDFEQLIVQAKFTMGETTIYSQKEQAYLKAWLGKVLTPVDAEELFKQGFLPGSLQSYEKSLLRKTLLQAHTPTPISPPVKLPLAPIATPSKEQIEQEKMETIDRLLARWFTSEKNKQLMYIHLKEQHPEFVAEIAKNPRKNEVLAKLFSGL